MALITCPECGKLVSEDAKFCPNCGCNLQSKDSQGDQNTQSNREDQNEISGGNTQGDQDNASETNGENAQDDQNRSRGASGESTRYDQEKRDDDNSQNEYAHPSFSNDPLDADPSDGQEKQQERQKKPSTKKKLWPVLVIVAAAAAILTFVLSQTILTGKEQAQVIQVQTDIAEIGTVGEDSGDAIYQAEEEYAVLSDKCRRHVDNYEVLQTARADYDKLLARNAQQKIAKLENITTESEQDIQEAKAAYAALTEDQKALVTNASLLDNADQRLIEAKAAVVEQQIDEIGEVTPETTSNAVLIRQRNLIEKARQAFDDLGEAEQKAVKNLNVLEKAEQTISDYDVQSLIAKIDSIGKVSLKSIATITNAERAYEQMTTAQQEKITNIETLREARKTYDVLYEKYQKEKKEKAAEAAKQAAEKAEKEKILKVGDVISADGYEITLQSAVLTSRINPNDTSGYYSYYYPPEGSVYVDLVFRVKNVATYTKSLYTIVDDYSIDYGGTNYWTGCSLFVSYGSQIDKVYSWDGIGALETYTLHVVGKLPSEAVNDGKAIKVNLTVAGKKKECTIRK